MIRTIITENDYRGEVGHIDLFLRKGTENILFMQIFLTSPAKF